MHTVGICILKHLSRFTKCSESRLNVIAASVWVTVAKRVQIKSQRAAFTQIYMIVFIRWHQPPPQLIYNTTGTVAQGWRQTHTGGSRRAGRAAVWRNTSNQRNYTQTTDIVLLLFWDYFSLQLCLSDSFPSTVTGNTSERGQMVDAVWAKISSSILWDLAWEQDGHRFKSSMDEVWSVDWLLERCQFTSWELQRT